MWATGRRGQPASSVILEFRDGELIAFNSFCIKVSLLIVCSICLEFILPLFAAAFAQATRVAVPFSKQELEEKQRHAS
jgi:hypothetical protein